MTRQQNRIEILEAFMPSIRMMLLSAFCLSLGAKGADGSNNTFVDNEATKSAGAGASEHYYTFEAIKERILNGPSALSVLDKVVYFVVLALGFEVFNYMAINLGEWIHARHLPVRGQHLDEFTQKDKLFLFWNKISNGPFVLIAFMYINWDTNFLWDPQDMTWMSVALPFPLFFIVYDFFYTLGHMFLHQKGIYPLIHKHHHRQQSPSRGSIDALNVHPIEYAFGQYNGLFAMFLICRCMPMHIVCGNLIMFATNAASCFNHQRYDIRVPFLYGINLYESKSHDLHHRIPNVNFGQYIQLWDWIFGSHRPYSMLEKYEIDPMNQLDPKTGQTLAFAKAQKKSS